METFFKVQFIFLGIIFLLVAIAYVYRCIRYKQSKKMLIGFVNERYKRMYHGQLFTLKGVVDRPVMITKKIIAEDIPFVVYKYVDSGELEVLSAKQFIYSVKQFEYEV